MMNRVAITKAVTIRSVNGPAVTVIQGAGPIGDSAVRCVYVGTNAVLSGFTLTQGATRSSGNSDREQKGGGAWCETSGALSNCVLSGNSASYYGGGAYYGMLNHCTLSGNSASVAGGGAYGSTLNHCTLSSNSASYGGGADSGVLNYCTLSGNSASDGGGACDVTLNYCTLLSNSASVGGGAFRGTLNYCTLSDNSASYGGGGALGGILNHCILSDNSASYDGGGAYNCALNNCVLTGNSAFRNGGGAYGDRPGGEGGEEYECTLNNCALTGNSASDGGGTYYSALTNCTLSSNTASSGGGASGGTLNNCIVYYNDAAIGPNFSFSIFNYSCTTPNSGGVGNITNEPMFVDRVSGNFRLKIGSACIDAGNNAYASGTTDLDGHPRIVNDVVDMGAYEYDGWKYDSDIDGMKDAWESRHGLNPTNSEDASLDNDNDGAANLNEYIADTNPTNDTDYFHIAGISNLPPIMVYFQSSTSRMYSLEGRDELMTTCRWSIVGSQSNIWGTGATMPMSDTNVAVTARFYRLKVKLPSDDSPVSPGRSDNVAIIFQSNRAGNMDIWGMTEDGNSVTQLTTDAADEDMPVWSPTGDRILYRRQFAGNEELWIMNVDGSGKTNILISSGSTISPRAWLPDANGVIYTKDQHFDCEIYVWKINTDGTGEEIFLNPSFVGDVSVYATSFSRDGKHVLWASQNGCWSPTLEIFSAPFENGTIQANAVVQLTSNNQYEDEAQFSPAGSRIVFLRSEHANGYSSPYNIYVMNSDGTSVTRLTFYSGSFCGVDPSWAHDGSKIVFTSNSAGNGDIWVMSSTGTGLTNLTSGSPADDGRPQWRP